MEQGTAHAGTSGWRGGATAAGLVLAVGLLLQACSAAPAPESLRFEGPEAAWLDAEAAERATFTARAEGDGELPGPEELRILLDGEDVTGDAERSGDELTYAPGGLGDGEHRVAVVRPGPGEDDDDEVLEEWRFGVDTEAPELSVTPPEGPVVAGEELTVTGTAEEGAVVEAAGREIEVAEDGGFELELDEAPGDALDLVAVDRAGNRTEESLELVTVPSRVEVDELRAVHVSFCAWSSDSLREPVLQAIEEGRINAVQLDLKDETGTVGFDSGAATAERVGADEPPCRVDLDAAVAELHDLGVPVIGRIVAFADPVLARWAWDNGERDWVIQTAGGDMFTGKYDGFSNFASDEVVDYTLEVAEAAAAAGVDHILWDYLRKPDGPLEQFHFAGLEQSPEERLVDFVRRADERLAPYGVQHGASLYGVSADRPTEVSQDVEAMAEHLDYVSPMIYPSHWGPGEYDVADPLMQPGDIVAATLEVWQEATEGKRARVAPWLEDSQYPVSLGFPDRARYVREQIEATYDAGIHEWILWDSAVSYTDEAMVAPPQDDGGDEGDGGDADEPPEGDDAARDGSADDE